MQVAGGLDAQIYTEPKPDEQNREQNTRQRHAHGNACQLMGIPGTFLVRNESLCRQCLFKQGSPF